MLRERTDIDEGAFGKALHYALLDEYELAMESLEAGFAAGDPLSSYINFMDTFDPLRDDPRFIAHLESMNIEP